MQTEEAASVAEKPQVKVKITREQGHRHAGTKHAKDTVISVSESDAQAIVSLKAGEIVKGGK
ncbi:hypothetical protein DMX10_31990 [Pseudomonas sp. 57B-090624]|uniref:hypothetical protein n=1 Tax=Pseudomonas sp. 57B-090624 TaxID=2213080 RepID=UPI000DAA30DE|nr:hypothetical protein [Pseudomonas sp. 57B-090624]PZE09273.1 hypothetical protein DMX10_31990 [Pseudomonas sp. 57B-090624]